MVQPGNDRKRAEKKQNNQKSKKRSSTEFLPSAFYLLLFAFWLLPSTAISIAH
jgi:hypothetical protein